MVTVLNLLWFIFQFIFGIHLVIPMIMYLWWKVRGSSTRINASKGNEVDYAIIVTAYEQTDNLHTVVNSLLALNYSNYLIYVVADKCDITNLSFSSPKVVLLRPPDVLGSNVKSHIYAMSSFIRIHDKVTIIDSDNLVDPNYLISLNKFFVLGYQAVQGVRKAKNTNTTIATLDTARDMYYHFYDGKILFELGSSATLAGSGMAFDYSLYQDFTKNNIVEGAGFDKVLQAWIVKRNLRIAFAEEAVVYDEKTTRSGQLVNQRSRWINTWFKYFYKGFAIIKSGVANSSMNQFLFGLILVRPPLFIFIIISFACLIVNVFYFPISALLLASAFVLFILGFYLALKYSSASSRIYKSLISIPIFMFLQMVSLVKSKSANKRSVATKHYQFIASDKLDEKDGEAGS